jgi:hypothetical protein
MGKVQGSQGLGYFNGCFGGRGCRLDRSPIFEMLEQLSQEEGESTKMYKH